MENQKRKREISIRNLNFHSIKPASFSCFYFRLSSLTSWYCYCCCCCCCCFSFFSCQFLSGAGNESSKVLFKFQFDFRSSSHFLKRKAIKLPRDPLHHESSNSSRFREERKEKERLVAHELVEFLGILRALGLRRVSR